MYMCECASVLGGREKSVCVCVSREVYEDRL